MVSLPGEPLSLASYLIELPEEELGWCSIKLQEVIQRESRLKAAVLKLKADTRENFWRNANGRK